MDRRAKERRYRQKTVDNLKLDPSPVIRRERLRPEGRKLHYTPRDTFRVARALRDLASDLPDVVRNRQAERAAFEPKRSVNLEDNRLSPAHADTRPRVDQSFRREPPQLQLLPEQQTCKERPKRRSGGGSGRRFVPWCNKK